MRPDRTPKRLSKHLLKRRVDEFARWKMSQPEFKAAIVAGVMEELMPARWFGKSVFDFVR